MLRGNPTCARPSLACYREHMGMTIARNLGIAIVTTVLLITWLPSAGSAAELRTGEQPSIGGNETITEDIYIAGGNVTGAGVMRADLIAAGGNVLVSGSVGGDVAAAGGSITILGNVADDIRVGGGNVVIQGAVGGDAVLAGGQLNLGGAGVGGDVLAGGGTIRIDAPVSGDVRIAGGSVYLNSTVRGNVEVFADTLTLGRNARIGGTLTYTAGKEATMEEGATVAGEVSFDKRERAISVGGVVAVLSFALIVTFISQLVAALLLALLFRRFAVRLVEDAAVRPLLEAGRGLVVFIVLPVASMMLLYTIIGIPLGLLGFLVFGVAFVYLWIMTPVLLGSLTYRAFFGGEFEVHWKSVLLGVFIYTVLGIIPIVGWLVQFILMLLTLGVTAKLKWEVAKEWR